MILVCMYGDLDCYSGCENVWPSWNKHNQGEPLLSQAPTPFSLTGSRGGDINSPDHLLRKGCASAVPAVKGPTPCIVPHAHSETSCLHCYRDLPKINSSITSGFIIVIQINWNFLLKDIHFKHFIMSNLTHIHDQHFYYSCDKWRTGSHFLAKFFRQTVQALTYIKALLMIIVYEVYI